MREMMMDVEIADRKGGEGVGWKEVF